MVAQSMLTPHAWLTNLSPSQPPTRADKRAVEPASVGERIPPPAKPRLLYLVTEDWFFCQHFLPMARAAQGAGFEVVLATRVRRHAGAIAAEGVRVVALEGRRGSLGAWQLLHLMARIAAVIRAERPHVVHCIALPMVVLGGVVSCAMATKSIVLAPTGLGHLWIANGLAESIARRLVRVAVSGWLAGPRTCYLFENGEDARELGLDPRAANVRLVGGPGVDPTLFPCTPDPPAPPVKVAVVARMLKSKGIVKSIAAVSHARAQGVALELHLFGEPDPSNPMSLSSASLLGWTATSGRALAWRHVRPGPSLA